MSDNNIFERLDELERGQQDILSSVDELKRDSNATPISEHQRIADERAMIEEFIHHARCVEYAYRGTRESFVTGKRSTITLLALYVLLSILVTASVTVGARIYTTFTFFENLWLVCSVFMLVYTVSARYDYDAYTCANRSVWVFESIDGVPYRMNKLKKKYTYLPTIAVVCAVMNIIYGLVSKDTNLWLIIIPEIAYIVMTFITYKNALEFFAPYDAIKYTGYNLSRTKEVSVYYGLSEDTYYTEKEYRAKYGEP